MSVSGSESCEDGQFLVRVRAQVMTRDDSSGGWVPLCGGGLSNVSVRKRIPDKNEYLIFGIRISDQSVVLSCTIKKDFEYNKVMPTFHHWKTGNKKFGLTFQTAADARAFDKGVRMAVEYLLDGVSESSPLHKYTTDTGDDDVFMALELPVERESSSSASSRGSGAGGVSPFPPVPHLHRMYFSSSKPPQEVSKGTSTCCSGNCTSSRFYSSHKLLQSGGVYGGGGEKKCDGGVFGESEEIYSSYVQFSSGGDCSVGGGIHDYSYPTVPHLDSSKSTSTPTSGRQSKSLTLDPLTLPAPPLLPTKTTSSSAGSVKKKRSCGKRRRCVDCNEVYSEDCNPRGSCESGPDRVRDCIETVSCLGCARGVLYHCVSGCDGDLPPHPCSLSPPSSQCRKRWLTLLLLSLLLPCLCLYPPLHGCHRIAKRCALCGARHHPS